MFTDDTNRILKSYVYLYIDPRDGSPFYIGKGKGGRLYAHLDEASDHEKTRRIADIRADGLEPRIEFLRYGLTDAQAALVEAAAIDVIGLSTLTNKVSGQTRGEGRVGATELLSILEAKPVDVTHAAILIKINRLYRHDMSETALYDATRGIWKVNIWRARKVPYAMAVYQGVVREVYKIDQWHPAGTTIYAERDASNFEGEPRWEFTGSVATDIRDQYFGFSVGKSGQNPIRYVNA